MRNPLRIRALVFLFFISQSAITARAQTSWEIFGTLQEARHFHQAGYIGNGRVLVIGGRVNSNGGMTGAPTTSCEIIDLIDSTISSAQPMKVARAEFVALVTPGDSNIIAISGISEDGETGGLTTTCELYNRTTGKWEVIGNLLVARRQHAATFINDSEILVIGGREQYLGTLADAEIFNIATGKSRRVQDFPYPINSGFVGLSSTDEPLAGAGRNGGTNGNRYAALYRYDINNNTWTEVSRTTEAVQGARPVRLHTGQLFISGGTLAEYPYTTSHLTMLEQNNKFTALQSLKSSREHHNVVQWAEDSVMSLGGQGSPEVTVHRSTEWTNITTGKTTLGPQLNFPHRFFATVAIPFSGTTFSTIVAISGMDNSGKNINVVEVFKRFIVSPPAPCTKISGVINNYTAVTQISNSKIFVTVTDTAGFKKDAQVLFIQMQGAEIDTTNTAKYGSVKSTHGAGDYEFAVIAGVSGNTITFTAPLKGQKYDVNGKIQLVTMPEYGRAIVRDSLTAAPWNGTTGGILALAASCVSLEGNVDVSGKGFRGGAYHIDPLKPEKSDSLYSTSLSFFGNKGEGVAGYGNGANVLGRGAPANGGGGGNSHNGGGGGGSNAGIGGKGGFGYEVTTHYKIAGGLGGSFTNTTPDKILMGGGGGAGQINDGHGSAGGAGGGIIIIRSGNIENNDKFTISANGQSAANDNASSNPDGCGGGGAGGTIILDAIFSGNIPVISLKGGNGGSRTASVVGHGTGGGGGGGLLLTTDEAIYSSVSTQINGGAAGSALEGGTYGAAAGTNGAMMKILPTNLAGVLKTIDSDKCKTCYPTIETAQQLCSPATFIAKDDIYPLQSIELDKAQSDNVTMQLSGSLPSNVITGTLTLIDPTKPGKFLLRAVNEDDNSVTYGSQVYPVPSPSVNSSGANLSANNTQTTDVLQWYYNGTAIIGATGKNHKAANSGEYYLEATNIYGCKGTSEKVLVTISGIEDNVVNDEFFALYPNPAAGQLYIETKQIINTQLTVEITNILGASAFKTNLQAIGNPFKTSVSLKDLPSGTYYVHITSGTFKKVYKIVRN